LGEISIHTSKDQDSGMFIGHLPAGYLATTLLDRARAPAASRAAGC
jgi:hypothetical protein